MKEKLSSDSDFACIYLRHFSLERTKPKISRDGSLPCHLPLLLIVVVEEVSSSLFIVVEYCIYDNIYTVV